MIMQYRLFLLALFFGSLHTGSSSPDTRVALSKAKSQKSSAKKCQNIFELLSFPSKFKSITVLSLQPVRLRVEMEMTTLTGKKETLTTEGEPK